mgnify:CR=1 FL=1
MSVKFSLEFFPPKTKGAYHSMTQAVDELAHLGPEFMTVTYGAGGSTKDQTRKTVLELASKYDCPIAAHLTAVGASRDEICEIASDYYNNGIDRLVVLRGDPPPGEKYVPHPDGFPFAVDCVEALMKLHDFDITVAAYAEGHPEAPSLSFDMDNLKRKLDAGAKRAITQFFFDPELYLRFRDSAAKAGIEKEVIPGLVPILNFRKIRNFAEKCGAPIPNFLHQMFDGVGDDDTNHSLFAMNVLSHQVTRLAGEGVRNIHFYTLNETLLTSQICRWLKIGF